MPRKYRSVARCILMSNAAGEARGSVFKVKSGGPPLSGLLVHVVAVIRTVPPVLRSHRPSIVGLSGCACRFDCGHGAGAKARHDSDSSTNDSAIRRMAGAPG